MACGIRTVSTGTSTAPIPPDNHLVAAVIGFNTWETVVIIRKGANYGTAREGTEMLEGREAAEQTAGRRHDSRSSHRCDDDGNGRAEVSGRPVRARTDRRRRYRRGIRLPRRSRAARSVASTSSAIFQQDVSGTPISKRCLLLTTTIRSTQAPIHELPIWWDNPADSPNRGRQLFANYGRDRRGGVPLARREGPRLPGTAAIAGSGRVDLRFALDKSGELVSAQQERRNDSSSHGSRSAKTLEPSEELVCSPGALDRPRRHRRLLRARARQSRPAAADRRALPRSCSAFPPSSSTAASCPARRSRSSSATSSTPSRRGGWPSARDARTSARCPTASTPSRSSRTCSS